MGIETNDLKKVTTVKNVIRFISLFLIAIFFAPAFLVSCSGQNVDISAKAVTFGYSYRGEKVIEPHLICILLLLIPVALLVIWFMKRKFSDKALALLTGVAALIDFIIWIVLKNSIKKTALESAFTFKTTGWFIINQILLVVLCLIAVGIYLNYIKAETTIISASGNSKLNISLPPRDSSANSSESNLTMGYCENCGNKIQKGNQFCTKCGSKLE